MEVERGAGTWKIRDGIMCLHWISGIRAVGPD